jgi:hypothetical protein
MSTGQWRHCPRACTSSNSLLGNWLLGVVRFHVCNTGRTGAKTHCICAPSAPSSSTCPPSMQCTPLHIPPRHHSPCHYDRFLDKGPVFRLAFGPKAFIVISDPVLARHLLRDKPESFSKGILAEILEPIMGKGLIPADLATWKLRRRAIVPAFHQAYLAAMTGMFAACTQRSIDKLEAAARASERGETQVNMEDEFLSIALDIIGIGVFNHDFGSVTKESPVIKAVYRCLREAVRTTCSPRSQSMCSVDLQAATNAVCDSLCVGLQGCVLGPHLLLEATLRSSGALACTASQLHGHCPLQPAGSCDVTSCACTAHWLDARQWFTFRGFAPTITGL